MRYEVKKVWVFYEEEVYGYVGKDCFIRDPDVIFDKKTRDMTLTPAELEILKRYEALLHKAGINRIKVVEYNIGNNKDEKIEEICKGCKKQKDIGKPCWWCGGK